MNALVAVCLDEGDAAVALYNELRANRYDVEIHSAMPLAGVRPPRDTRPGRIARVAAGAAAVGAVLAIAAQYYTGEMAYPVDIGGRGVNWLAYSFVAISLAMMWAAVASVVAFLRLSGLPDLRARLFASSALEKIAQNRYVIVMEVASTRTESIRESLIRRDEVREVEVVGDDA